MKDHDFEVAKSIIELLSKEYTDARDAHQILLWLVKSSEMALAEMGADKYELNGKGEHREQ